PSPAGRCTGCRPRRGRASTRPPARSTGCGSGQSRSELRQAAAGRPPRQALRPPGFRTPSPSRQARPEQAACVRFSSFLLLTVLVLSRRGGARIASMAVEQGLDARRIQELDKQHVLHSWSVQNQISPLPVAGAEGRYFWDHEGNRYLDFASQLVNVNLGHQHPKVVAAI